jgi:hypothetical protein
MSADRFAGMTMNERLFEAGLLEAFDAAFSARDRGALIDIYRQVGRDGEMAERSVDMMLANPDRYDPAKFNDPRSL